MHEGVIVWALLLIPSAIVGILCARFIKHGIGFVLAGLIPWLGLLAVLLYNEYFVPYRGGGASMWLVAQLFAGTIMAVVGFTAYAITRIFFNTTDQP